MVRRRRECPECGRRFTTYERPTELPLVVAKKDGRREQFDRDKVAIGMTKACEKRPITQDAIERAVDEIERVVRDELAEEVPARHIGTLVMEKLRAMDEVAYVRFASVYKEFRDAGSFLKEVELLSGKPADEPDDERQTSLFDVGE